MKMKAFIGSGFLILAILVLFGCAGMRMGYFSRPYFGVERPKNVVATTPGEQKVMQTMSFEGITLTVNIMNDLQTSDTLWFGIEVPMVPTKADLKNQWRYVERQEGHCIHLELKSQLAGIELWPRNCIFIVDGVPATAARVVTRPYRMDGGIVDEKFVLMKGEPYAFELCYQIKRPTPDQQLQLDLRESFVLPTGKLFPIINFQKQRYHAPYG